MLLSDMPCAQVNSLSIMGEEKPEESLWGNVSLLRGCQRQQCVAIHIISISFFSYTSHSKIYACEKFYWLTTDVIV